MERRIARRYVTDSVVEIWIPRKGMLGRARTADLPVAEMSMFGTSIIAHKNEKVRKGQVIQVTIGDQQTSAIVRSERATDEDDDVFHYGVEFIKPGEDFLNEVRAITEACRRMCNEDIREEHLWLRSS